MKRFVLRNAIVPSCAFALILVAAACGGVGNSDLLDVPLDSGTDARATSTSSTTSSGGTSSSSSGASSSGSSTSSSSASSSGSSTSSSSSSGDPPDAGDPDADIPDSSVQDSSVQDSSVPDSGSSGGVADAGSADASDGAVCAVKEICGDGIDNDCNGVVDDGCTSTLGTYVSEQTGQDNNPGTKAAPVKTIAQGIANAVTIGGAQTVYVAEGHYAEKVTLTEGVSLLGGHSCSGNVCTWTQNPTVFVTSIDDQDGEGVLAPKTITKNTKFEGFRVNGKSGNASAVCMTLDQSSPVVRGNTFTPGAVTGRAVGVVVLGPTNDAAGAVLDANTISGGSGTSVWVGISLDRKSGGAGGANVIAQITKNKITGGKAPASFGIAGSGSAAGTLVQDNDILAGTSSGTGGSWGIQVSSSMTIDRNRINLDTVNAGSCIAQAACGGIISQSSTTTITNNIVFGMPAAKSAAVLLAEAEGPPGPVVLNGNYLDGGGFSQLATTPTISAALWLRICAAGTCGTNAIIGRLRNDIFVGGMNENRYGIYEEQISGRTAHPDKLDADDFYFALAPGRKDSLYHFWNGTTATDLTTTAAIGTTVKTTPPPSNLFNVDPAVDTTFHLTAASKLPDQGTITDAPALDFDGEKRPQGTAVDIGPDEAK